MNARDQALGSSFSKTLAVGDKVCLLFIHEGCFIFIVRIHDDNTVSVEAAGGKIDPKGNGEDETAEEALVREAEQEVGVKVSPDTILHSAPNPRTTKQLAFFACELMDGYPYNAATDEHLGIIRVPISLGRQGYDVLEEKALSLAGELLDSKNLSSPPRSIEFRVPDVVIKNFFQQLRDESGAPFLTREPLSP